MDMMNENERMVKQFEALCEKLYVFNNANERAEAEQTLLPFSTQPEYINRAKLLLDSSASPYAQHFASSSITKLVTKFWNSFPLDMRLEIRDNTLAFLANNCLKFQPFVLSAVIQLITRITKLGWLDDPRQHNILDEVQKFLNHAAYYSVGLRLLNQLVSEFNEITALAGQTWSEHRKISNSFRDKCMLQIFKTSLTSLVDLYNNPQASDQLKDQSLELSHKCLTYDFVGTSPDDSVDDLSSVQVPISWKSLFEDDSTVKLFLNIYMTSVPPRSSQAMQCLAQIASIRSLFNEAERDKFLLVLIEVTKEILTTNQGLNDKANHHEFCRLLARLKGNFQASSIVAVTGYGEWISKVAVFTMNSFSHWRWSPNSVFFLLTFWSRLVMSVYYIKNKEGSMIETYAPQIMQSFFTSRLEAISLQIMEGDDDEDEDEDQLMQQLEALPHLARCKYDTTRNFIVQVFDPIIQKFNILVEKSNSKEFKVVEAQLASLMEWIGCIIGGRQHIHASEEHDVIDADLSSRVFNFMRAQLTMIHQSPEAYAQIHTKDEVSLKISIRVEIVLLDFIENFRKAYVSDQASISSKIYTRLQELIGIAEPQTVLHLFVTKLATNLKYWTKNEKIIYQTLKELQELSTGYSSSKFLIKLDITSQFFTYHTSQFFPFLDSDSNTNLRSLYYTVLARLLFVEDNISKFESFMEPFKKIFILLRDQSVEVYRTEQCKRAIIGLFKDLAGIIDACSTRRSYFLLLDWMYNFTFTNPNDSIEQQQQQLQQQHPSNFFFVLQRTIEALYDCGEAMNPILHFVSEFAYNKSGRIFFEPSSVGGILLFKEISNLLATYGRRIVTYVPNPNANIYTEKYKGISKCLVTLNRALVGNYVNFGVFRLYGDRCFEDTLSIVMGLALSIPIRDLMSYTKVTKAFYSLFEYISEKFPTVLIKLDDASFLQLLLCIKEGMSYSVEVGIVTQSCSIIERIVSYREREKEKEREREREGERAPERLANIQVLNQHIFKHNDIFSNILTLLFQKALDNNSQNLWSFSRPLLSLIMLNPDHFIVLKNQLINRQPEQRRAMLVKDFEDLMKDVKSNLEPSNRDKFSQNFNIFVQEVRKYAII